MNEELSTLLSRTGERHRGLHAALRKLLSDATRPQAWPAMASAGLAQGIGNPAAETVAGLFGLHPMNNGDPGWNFGATCRAIARKSEGKIEDEDHPFHKHFRRLVSCRTTEEACEVVRRLGRVARSREVPINYTLLLRDLRCWNQPWVRESWARTYFAAERPATTGEDAA